MREQLFAALFDKLSTVSGFTTKSRILKHWADVPAIEQPAMFLAKANELQDQLTGQPTKLILEARLWVYAYSSDKSIAPSTTLNNLLDGIQAALKPQPSPTFKQTLGELCEHCWIDGNIETDEGTLGEQAVAIIPIKILTTT